MESQTIRKLADITDVGLFEKVATAVLRIANPRYAVLTHPGINAQGKTQKSPVDGVGFADGAVIIAHHTITAASGLKRKWLLVPEAVTPRKRKKNPDLYEPGDVVKALAFVREERQRASDLGAKLLLTSNQEPDAKLIADAVAAGRAENVDVEVWSRSKIAHVLDLDPAGQIVRRKLLQIEEDLLSPELLKELGARSVADFQVGDDTHARVERRLDQELFATRRPLTFVVAASGKGKSVACHKAVQQQVANGGAALVLPHEMVETATSLEQAVMSALAAAKPSLHRDQSPLALLSAEDPLLIVVEDISRSDQPHRLIEKLASWAPGLSDTNSTALSWRVLCPIWPHLMAGVSSQTGDRIKSWVHQVEDMSGAEAEAAAIRHAAQQQVSLSQDQTHTIAAALGNDPLLIALNADWANPLSERVIERFVEDVLARTQVNRNISATELRMGLREFGVAMLARRQRDVVWDDVLSSWNMRPQAIDAVRALLQNGELLALAGASARARIRFRHDRVRDWLLVDAALALDAHEGLPDAVVAEPMLAEVIAGVLVRHSAPQSMLQRVVDLNPLALFHGIRLAPVGPTVLPTLVAAAEQWIAAPEHRGRAFAQMRWAALAAIEDVAGAFMPALLKRFPAPQSPMAMVARVRNGDLGGGIDLCAWRGLQTSSYWLERPISTAKARSGAKLTKALADLIDGAPFDDAGTTSGLIAFSGIWGEAELGPNLSSLWSRDDSRAERLSEYLWAMARCATPETAATLLAPICQMWGELPEERENNNPSPRDDLADHDVRWSMEITPPVGAMGYLIERAEQPDLRWQIEYLLHGVDDPAAIAQQVRRAAERRREHPDYYGVNYQAREHWRRMRDGHGRSATMTPESRAWLLDRWSDPNIGEHERIAAFDLWSVTGGPTDIVVLRDHAGDTLLAERILRARLERGDSSAIAALVEKLDGKSGLWWWSYARHVWSPALLAALDRALARYAANVSGEPAYDIGNMMMRTIMRLPISIGEELLLKYWTAFGNTEHFVQAALYVGTSELRARAAATVAMNADPKPLFRFLTSHFGIRHFGEAGITREQQILALEPYLQFLDQHQLSVLADECDRMGWIDTRRRLFDGLGAVRQTGSPKDIRAVFDRLVEDNRHAFIDHDVDAMLKAGASFDDIATVLRDWLPAQSSTHALDVAANVLIHAGRRQDLDILQAWAGEPVLREAVVADTTFAVRRQRS